MNDRLKGLNVRSRYLQITDWIRYASKKNSTYFFHFFTGQFLLQIFNILNGFFLLRWLSIAEQAKFSIAFSIQTLIIALSDLGFTGSIVALVGNRIHDKKIVGSYIQSARRLRSYFLLLSCSFTIIVLPFIIRKQAWSYWELTLMMLPVLLSAIWQADCGVYDSALVMNKKMKELYTPQVSISIIKLMANFLLFITSAISALSTLLLNAFALLFNSRIFKKKAMEFIDLPENNSNVELKEMLRYLKPVFPVVIIATLYGQMQIFLISLFGKTTNIAEIAALGKLAQIFIFLGSLNGIIIAPFIAKTSPKELAKRYLTILSISSLITVFIILSSFLFPGFYLFFLGPKYNYLKGELNLIIINSCLSYIGGVMWTMHTARKWIFWWATWCWIICVVACQIIGILFFDISSTHGVITIGTLTTACILLVHAQTGLAGFYRNTKESTSLL